MPASTPFVAIHHFAAVHAAGHPGAQIEPIRTAVPNFREWFRSRGTAVAFHSFDLITLPYPVRYGLWRAARSPAPFLWFTNRMFLVQWRAEGRLWTLLNEPTDYELAANTPYFAGLARRFGQFLAQRVLTRRHGTVAGHLAAAGLTPADVDFITFDHLHTQDVRRWLGTTRPQADLSPERPLPALFPRARLIVQRREWAALSCLHPLQQAWYQPESFRDLPPERLILIDGDVLLGPGVALLLTPGHTHGNQSLVVNTESGIWVCSENAVAAECYAPEWSEIPGLRRYARETGLAVVLNANTIEATARQYNSMLLEKWLADSSARDPRFPQCFPTSELTPHLLSPGTRPTFQHRRVACGQIQRAGAGRPAVAADGGW